MDLELGLPDDLLAAIDALVVAGQAADRGSFILRILERYVAEG